VGKAQLIPGKAFDHERAYLCKLSGEIPSPYLSHVRRTDQYGYVAFGGNFYWVPGTHRDEVRVLEYACELKLYRRRELLTKYKLPAWGVTNQLFSPAGLPRPCFEPKNRKHSTTEEENRLRGMGAVVGEYLDFALAPKGNERHRFVRALFHLTQRMTTSLFLKTLGRALKYQIVDVDTVWRIAQLELGEGMEILPEALIDESYQERDAYQEGRLSEAPDFSRWDDMLEEDNG
jgi:hypothetical protein